MIREESSSSFKSARSGTSQLVDLVVEDTDAEVTERVRARKDGGAEWNENEPKHFLYIFRICYCSLIAPANSTTEELMMTKMRERLSVTDLRRQKMCQCKENPALQLVRMMGIIKAMNNRKKERRHMRS